MTEGRGRRWGVPLGLIAVQVAAFLLIFAVYDPSVILVLGMLPAPLLTLSFCLWIALSDVREPRGRRESRRLPASPEDPGERPGGDG